MGWDVIWIAHARGDHKGLIRLVTFWQSNIKMKIVGKVLYRRKDIEAYEGILTAREFLLVGKYQRQHLAYITM